jgi:hypothetical protein
VRLQVLDTSREDSDLDIWRTSVTLMSRELFHKGFLFFMFHKNEESILYKIAKPENTPVELDEYIESSR